MSEQSRRGPGDEGDPTRIVIVGGGLAGLVLARVLTRGGVPVTVLERDRGPDARGQGGSLDLHPDSGQRALVAAGLIEPFHQHARPQGKAIRILDPAGREHVRHEGTPNAFVPDDEGILPGRPEIDRARLRRLLVESLPPGVVHWGRQVSEVEAAREGRWRVRCADGAAYDVDLVVGADGARSRVRGLLTPARPETVGVGAAMLWLRDLDRWPGLAERIGPGSLWCLGDNLNVGAQRGGDGHARVSVMARHDADGARIAPGATQADLLCLIRGWSPRITELVARADEDVAIYEIETLPTDLSWPTRPGLTLIGDAAHLMPPVGEGANQGMLDGAELGRALLGAPGGADAVTAAIGAAEAAMFARIGPIATRSVQLQATMVSASALASMTQMFSGRA